ncbi:MAG TPA: hypothetical protein VGS61_02325 [Acidimicrobiales bacterium]|nr:hypothetical protein [Acidimicrobiales bacterium]
MRAVFALVLATLVAVGLTLEHHASGVGAPATTSTVRSSGPTTSAPAHSTTTTTPPHPTGPVVNVGSLDQTARGCGLVARRPGRPVTTTTVRRVAGVGRCTVVEIGDSLGNDLGWALARELERTPSIRLVQLDKSSTGLAATWFYSWPVTLRHAITRFHPNLVLVMLGGNDEQAMKVDGGSASFGTRAWDQAYVKRIHDVVAESTKAGAYVLWVGLPVMEPPIFRAGARLLNSLYAREVPKVPGATFLPTWSLFADRAGGYRATAVVNGRPEVLRAADGIHFSVIGEDVLATYVAHEITAVYGVPLRCAEPAVVRG